METVMEEEEGCLSQEESVWDEDLDISQLCRICANPNEYLIPIFQGEGLEHELEIKIAKHLPIKVLDIDELPTNLCYQCASTLIAWHDMVVGCLEADEKLRTISRCRTGSNTKMTHQIITNDSVGEDNNQLTSSSSTRINKEQGSKLITSIYSESVIEEEETTSVKPDMIEDESLNTRCLGSFKAYHQTQVALRMLHWANRGPVFCLMCGKMRKNQMLLMKHLYFEHKMQCGHCDKRFVNEHQLARHMLTHGGETCLSEKILGHHNKANASNNKEPDSDGSRIIENKQVCDVPLFKCEVCSLSFSRRFDHKKHKIKYHSNVNFGPNKENGGSTHTHEHKVNSTKCKKEYLNVIKENESLSEDETRFKSDSDGSIKEEFCEDLPIKPEVRLLEAKYVCTLCNYSSNLKRDLILHERNIHSLENTNKYVLKGKKPHNCEMCKHSYIRKADLQRHIIKEHSNKEFSTKKNDSAIDINVVLVNRAKENINGIIVYHCEVCGKNLRTKKGFVHHLRVHTGERPFTCHICGKQYRSNTDLSRHLKCVHEGIKKYQCDICGQCFANKATRNDHRRTHTGEKPFMCDICGKSFPTPNSIYIHRRIHTNYFPHECKTCEKKFRRKQQLIHHTRTHTGERPHACDVCGKCFAVKDEVTRHKLTHSNEKPHICPNCGFAFAQKRYLTNHIKTHHADLK